MLCEGNLYLSLSCFTLSRYFVFVVGVFLSFLIILPPHHGYHIAFETFVSYDGKPLWLWYIL